MDVTGAFPRRPFPFFPADFPTDFVLECSMLAKRNRRRFLREAALSSLVLGAAPTVFAKPDVSPSEKLNIASIGVGGRGGANTRAMENENLIALCDVDTDRLGGAGRRYPSARKYVDFRELLDKEKELDAVVVSTPDHCHAFASVPAMRKGLHCYCEKPLTHSIWEARLMAETAKKHKVVTHMGTSAQSSEGHCRTVEMIRAGAIGDVTSAHVWTNRPIWPQGMDRPAGEDPIPKSLNWDLWIGPAPMRPFKGQYTEGRFKGKNIYHPFVWRGWWDFGTGACGDIAPHSMNVIFWALKLGAPSSVEATCAGMKAESFPDWSVVTYHFPAEGDRKAMDIVWYDGGKKPSKEITGGREVGDNGTLFIGTKGRLMAGSDKPYPEKDFADFKLPERTVRPLPEYHQAWIEAIKKGTDTGCPFDYSGPMTEAYLLGNIALKVGQKIEWNAADMKVTNCPEANQFVKREYREGWTL